MGPCRLSACESQSNLLKTSRNLRRTWWHNNPNVKVDQMTRCSRKIGSWFFLSCSSYEVLHADVVLLQPTHLKWGLQLLMVHVEDVKDHCLESIG